MENFIKLQTSSVGSTAKMFVSKYKKLNNTANIFLIILEMFCQY